MTQLKIHIRKNTWKWFQRLKKLEMTFASWKTIKDITLKTSTILGEIFMSFVLEDFVAKIIEGQLQP